MSHLTEYVWSLSHFHLYGTDVYVSDNRAVIECKALELVKAQKGEFEPWAMSDEDLLLHWTAFTDGEQSLVINRAPILTVNDVPEGVPELPLDPEVSEAIAEAGEAIRTAFPITPDLEEGRECCCSCCPAPEDMTSYMRGDLG